MKRLLSLLLTAFALHTVTSLAEPSAPIAAEATAFPIENSSTSKTANPPPWSVVGAWDCHQRDWSGTLTLQEDGSLLGPNDGLSGRWTLEGQGGQIHLVLYWNEWPAEIVAMVGEDEFHGNPTRGDLRMLRHRAAPPAVTMIPPHTELGSIETRTWRQEEPPLKLIRQDEGFCALTSVTGNFQGSGEAVRVYVGDDGYWYLGGRSHQEGVAATCLVIRYRNTSKASRSLAW